MTGLQGIDLTAKAECPCSGNHLSQDHWEFWESVPQTPAAMIDDRG
ncbi:hypothetical protein NDI45_14730 [Leptolyngbya sp. GB1-A1]